MCEHAVSVIETKVFALKNITIYIMIVYCPNELTVTQRVSTLLTFGIKVRSLTVVPFIK